MPRGEGTYGSKVGRPKKKKNLLAKKNPKTKALTEKSDKPYGQVEKAQKKKKRKGYIA